MLLFTGDETGRVIIPLSRVYDIESKGRKVTMRF